jgi:NAD(P)-dependent dehydrogenase (short-subunit alcohol dehydrogenase family)
MDVNVNGVLFTAQAAGQQMARFGNGGSIILIASMSGSITNKVGFLHNSLRLIRVSLF